MSQPAAPSHLDALTGIRGIAAWFVVFYHIRLSLVAILPPSVIEAFSHGYLAVDLFFMLSGFVIWYNYAAKIAESGWPQTRLFLWRRFSRVWPLHAAMLGGFLAHAALLAVTKHDISSYRFVEFPLHVLLIQNWGFSPNLSWNHPAWSISTEVAAYLLFPALPLALRWERVPSWVLAMLVAALAFGLHKLFVFKGYTGLGTNIPVMGLWRCLAGFAMGCLMCQLWQRWRAIRWASTMSALACAAIFAFGSMQGLAETAWIPAAFFTGLLALALGLGAKWLSGRALIYLGEISYSTYLSHYLLFVFYKLAFVDSSLQLGWSGIAGYLALVFAASVVLYHGLEKPAQRWLNNHPPRWAERRQALPAE